MSARETNQISLAGLAGVVLLLYGHDALSSQFSQVLKEKKRRPEDQAAAAAATNAALYGTQIALPPAPCRAY